MITPGKLLNWAASCSLIAIAVVMIGCAQATAEPSLEPQQTLGSPQDALASQTSVVGEEAQEDSPTSTTEQEVSHTPTFTPTSSAQATVTSTRNPTSAASSPAAPAATTRATSAAQPTSAPSSGDSSGNQSSLSAEEQSAASAGNANYSGQRCRIAEDFTCNCIPDTITVSFTFPDVNAGQMIFNASTGTATYQLGRKGINTWFSSSAGTTDQGTVTTEIQIIFNATGFQQTVTVRFPGGQAPVCTANWARQ
jgi:hypothetical protein